MTSDKTRQWIEEYIHSEILYNGVEFCKLSSTNDAEHLARASGLSIQEIICSSAYVEIGELMDEIKGLKRTIELLKGGTK